MTTTTRSAKPLNLTCSQSRRLGECGELLVVLPCEPQPTIEPTTYIGPKTGLIACWPGESEFDGCECSAPYAPGDVAPCKEPWELSVFDPEGGSYEDDPDNWDIVYQATDNGNWTLDEVIDGNLVRKPYVPEWRPARTLPKRAIRYRPVVERVECRQVCSITGPEVYEAGYPFSSDLDQLKRDWHRRYRRRGAAVAFERAYGWFVYLKLET